MYSCVICRRKWEGESEAVLFVNKYGVPRCLCPDCESLIDLATGEDEQAAKEARGRLSEVTRDMRDRDAMQVLRDVLDGKTSSEESPEDEEILEQFREVELSPEERAREDAEEEEQKRRDNSFLSWLPVIVMGAVAAAFLVWFFLFR